MAIRSSNKILPSFNMSSMTDLVFLLLIFFMITSTMVNPNPNAIKLQLPQSNNRTSEKAVTTLAIKHDKDASDGKVFKFYIEKDPVAFENIEQKLKSKLSETRDPVIALHVDKSVPMEEVVRVMKIAVNHKYKLILATSPER